MPCRSLLRRLLSPALGLTLPCLPTAAQSITNGTVTLHYVPHPTYGLELTSIENNSTGLSFPLAPTDLWEVTFRSPATGGLRRVTPSTPAVASSFSILPGSPNELTAVWTVTWTPSETVEARWTAAALADDDFVTFGMQVTSAGPMPVTKPVRHSLYRMELRLSAAGGAAPASEVLAVPLFLGILFRAPLESAIATSIAGGEGTPSTPPTPPAHPGTFTMQWAAFYEEPQDREANPVLFWGTRDAAFNLKPYTLRLEDTDAKAGNDGLVFGVHHYPLGNLTPGDTTAALPFPVVLSVLAGDWYDAARYYRSWATQPGIQWTQAGNMQGDPDFSALVEEAEVISTLVVERCTSSTIQSTCAVPGLGECNPSYDYANWLQWLIELPDLKSALGVDSVLFRPWVWDKNGTFSLLGDWLPAQTEYETVAPAIAQTEPVAPYFQVDFYSPDAPGYDATYVPGYPGAGIPDFTARDELGVTLSKLVEVEDRTLPCSVLVCPCIGPREALCLGTPFPSAYTIHLAEAAAAAGANGLYMDVYHTDPRLCYAESHVGLHHPQGDGRYWTEGKRDLLSDLRNHMRNVAGVHPEFFTFMEGASEAYLDLIEVCWNRYGGLLTSDASGVARAPMFQTVYNDYQMLGNTLVVTSQDAAVLDDQKTSATLRQAFSAHLFQGGEPFAGVALGPSTILQNKLAHPVYAQAIDMIADSLAVLLDDEVRDLVVFGQRLRDPDRDPASTAVVAWSGTELPYGEAQPLVYASLYGVPDLSTPKLALVLSNWTDAADGSLAEFSGLTPGDQTVDVTIDPSEYGFQTGQTCRLRLITPEAGSSGTFVYDGRELPLTHDVPARATHVFLLDLPAPALGR